MTAIQKFSFVLVTSAGLLLYIASGVLSEPPLWAKLFAKEEVTVIASEVQKRSGDGPALPTIEVRDASGNVSLVQGYQWVAPPEAATIIAAAPVGTMIDVPRYDGKLWRGLSGLGDWILLFISLIAVFVLVFGLLMLWKVRAR